MYLLPRPFFPAAEFQESCERLRHLHVRHGFVSNDVPGAFSAIRFRFEEWDANYEQMFKKIGLCSTFAFNEGIDGRWHRANGGMIIEDPLKLKLFIDMAIANAGCGKKEYSEWRHSFGIFFDALRAMSIHFGLYSDHLYHKRYEECMGSLIGAANFFQLKNHEGVFLLDNALHAEGALRHFFMLEQFALVTLSPNADLSVARYPLYMRSSLEVESRLQHVKQILYLVYYKKEAASLFNLALKNVICQLDYAIENALSLNDDYFKRDVILIITVFKEKIAARDFSEFENNQ